MLVDLWTSNNVGPAVADGLVDRLAGRIAAVAVVEVDFPAAGVRTTPMVAALCSRAGGLLGGMRRERKEVARAPSPLRGAAAERRASTNLLDRLAALNGTVEDGRVAGGCWIEVDREDARTRALRSFVIDLALGRRLFELLSIAGARRNDGGTGAHAASEHGEAYCEHLMMPRSMSGSVKMVLSGGKK